MRTPLHFSTTCLLIFVWQTTAAPALQPRTRSSNHRPGLGKTLGMVGLHVHTNTIHDHPWSEPSPSTTLRRAPASGPEKQECDFNSIQEFFEYAYEENLNITAEVQSCQKLCLLTYGTGNPDLSGIGVSNPCSRILLQC